MNTNRHRTLTGGAEIAAYLHPTRMAILRALSAGPATITQIAAQLDVHPANLTRHMRILQSAHLIAIVETRDTGRNLEKYYHATAESFDVPPKADALRAPHKISLSFMRSDLSAALAHLPDDLPGKVQVHLIAARLAPEQVSACWEQLERLAADFESSADDLAPDGTASHLALALYPAEPNGQDHVRVVLA